jgi:hypothetical protein
MAVLDTEGMGVTYVGLYVNVKDSIYRFAFFPVKAAPSE